MELPVCENLSRARKKLGIVVSSPDGNKPNVHEYTFILGENNIGVKHGQYCVTEGPEGIIVGMISQIHVDNKYFNNVQTIKQIDSAEINLSDFIPSKDWDCIIAEVEVLSIVSYDKDSERIDFKKVEKAGVPVLPGSTVYLLDGENLMEFLGIPKEGLFIGTLKNYKEEVRLELSRLFGKHLAILAQSGAGKSYLVSVLLEEIMFYSLKKTVPGILVIDFHGEYGFLTELNDKFHSQKVEIYSAPFLQIGVPNLSEYDIIKYQPSISPAQVRELRKAIDYCKRTYPLSKGGYDFKDIIAFLETEDINPKTRDTLISWLLELDNLSIFGKKDLPGIHHLIRLNKITIIDFSPLVSLRKKQILLDYIASRAFYMRKNKKIPPFILFIEEAHNFLPDGSKYNAISKHILETIAREGRKFYALEVLITQRPVHLSTTALSQCNSQIIMRITNPNDLDHIRATSEAITREALKVITTLPTGNALIMGTAINYPIFTKVRKRLLDNPLDEQSLESACKQYEQIQELEEIQESFQSLEEYSTETLEIENFSSSGDSLNEEQIILSSTLPIASDPNTIEAHEIEEINLPKLPEKDGFKEKEKENYLNHETSIKNNESKQKRKKRKRHTHSLELSSERLKEERPHTLIHYLG